MKKILTKVPGEFLWNMVLPRKWQVAITMFQTPFNPLSFQLSYCKTTRGISEYGALDFKEEM